MLTRYALFNKDFSRQVRKFVSIMLKSIEYGNKRISYAVKKSRRARYMRLQVRRDLSVTVVLPFAVPERLADCLVRERCDWIEEKLTYYKRNPSELPEPDRNEYLIYKKRALDIIVRKLAHFNQFYNFSWKKISVRNPRSRWGSCSSSGNLNFSYRLVFLPEELQDYIVVHELCHLKEFNHSQSFWDLMGKAIVDVGKKKRAIRSL